MGSFRNLVQRMEGKPSVILIQMLGLIFIFSAFLKSLDSTSFAVQISYFGLVRTPWMVGVLAILIVGLEALLGAMLLFKIGPRRFTVPITLGVLIGFSLLLAWAWVFTDIKDCGCFGKYLRMSPGGSLLKNFFLIGMGVAGWRGYEIAGSGKIRPELGQVGGGFIGTWVTDPHRLLPRALAGGITLLSIGLAIFSSETHWNTLGEQDRDPKSSSAIRTSDVAGTDRKFAQYRVPWNGRSVDLSRGTHWVALLSDSCEHCSELVAKLNQYSQDKRLPEVVGLILGEEDTFTQFKQTFRPQFATARIPALEFFDLIGSAPPRFYLVREGKASRFWDEDLPSTDEILHSIRKHGS